MKRDTRMSVTSAMTVFAVLYASTVIGTPLYRNGHTLLRFFVTALMLLLYTPVCCRYFSKREHCRKRGVLDVSACVFVACAVVTGAVSAARFADPLGSFAAYYGTPAVRLSAGTAVVLSAVYAAHHGKRAVTGLASLFAWFFPLWTGTGLLAFLTTKTALPITPPFAGADMSVFAAAVFETLPLLADVTAVSMLLGGKGGEEESVRRGMYGGVFAFLALAAVNVGKNLLLLGETFVRRTDVPNLAAIRLVPMLELPETAVIVGMAAAVVRVSVYASAAQNFGGGDKGRRGSLLFGALTVSAAAGCILMRFVPLPGSFAEELTAAFAILAAYASRLDGKKHKQTEKSDTV